MPCNEVFKTSVIYRCPKCRTDLLQITFNPETLDVAITCVPCYGDVDVLEHMKLRELPCNYRSHPDSADHPLTRRSRWQRKS